MENILKKLQTYRERADGQEMAFCIVPNVSKCPARIRAGGAQRHASPACPAHRYIHGQAHGQVPFDTLGTMSVTYSRYRPARCPFRATLVPSRRRRVPSSGSPAPTKTLFPPRKTNPPRADGQDIKENTFRRTQNALPVNGQEAGRRAGHRKEAYAISK
jgi:hypothetical protein